MDTWKRIEPGSRVIVAMSGGVDSSVAAQMLVERHVEVIGITMKNFCYSHVPDEYEDAACCSLSAIEDARAVARDLGIVHHVLDFEGPFESAVIDPFVDEYAAGRTPNPCERCNRFVRFPGLWRKARLLNAVGVATGHYARARRDASGRVVLERPADREKDQTFYLWGLTQSLLDRAYFPLGAMTKNEVRRRAAALGIETADKPESQDICFIPDGDLRGFLKRHRPAADRFGPGDIVDTRGERIGTHPGSGFFTVGQRRGLRIVGGEPRYVTAIEGGNTLVVGSASDLLGEGLEAEDVRWLDQGDGGPRRLDVQIRYRSATTPARVEPMDGDRAVVHFDAPVRAIAPGQSVVFYRGDRVIGGGTIARALVAA